MSELHLYDFGIFLELAPDEEEKQLLENNIQVALSQKNIDLEDAIDIREIKSVKLANQLLKVRRKRKEAKDRAIQQQNIQMQTQSNAQAAQAAAQAEVRKEQALAQTKIQIEQVKAQLESQSKNQEVALKKQLMEYEFELNMKLKQMEVEALKSRESNKEDRKDERTKIQASQQSELIEQRKSGGSPNKFESAGNELLGSGFNLGAFDPR